MKTLILIVLLFTSQFTYAITKTEKDCVVKAVYHEARSLPKQDWLKVANVIYNRSKYFSIYHFNATSKHLCDIVKSKEFASRSKLGLPIKELSLFLQIQEVLNIENWQTITNALFFETIKGKMYYKYTWEK